MTPTQQLAGFMLKTLYFTMPRQDNKNLYPKSSVDETEGFVYGDVNTVRTTIGVSEYRRITGNMESTDDMIMSQIAYLEALCRNIIRIEINHKNQHG